MLRTKVDEDEYNKIKELAEKSGTTVSRCMRDATLGYKLYARLTDHQNEMLDILKGVRSDIVKHTNALNALTHNERVRMFRNEYYLNQWIIFLDKELKLIDNFFSQMKKNE